MLRPGTSVYCHSVRLIQNFFFPTMKLFFFFFFKLLFYIGEGNGTPHQYSCLETPMDRGAGRLQSMELLRVRHD